MSAPERRVLVCRLCFAHTVEQERIGPNLFFSCDVLSETLATYGLVLRDLLDISVCSKALLTGCGQMGSDLENQYEKQKLGFVDKYI